MPETARPRHLEDGMLLHRAIGGKPSPSPKSEWKMTIRVFLAQLLTLTAASALVIAASGWVPVLAAYQPFAWLCLGFFVGFTVLSYFQAARAASDANPNTFLRLAILLIAVKMASCVLLVWAYVHQNPPETNWFLLPFFCLYVAYTIFETHMLMRLGKPAKRPRHERT